MGWKIVTVTLRFICQVDSTIDWKENQLTKRLKFQSELTELKARDTSCPRGKKVELKIIRTIGIFMCKGETNETTCDRYTKRNNR